MLWGLWFRYAERRVLEKGPGHEPMGTKFLLSYCFFMAINYVLIVMMFYWVGKNMMELGEYIIFPFAISIALNIVYGITHSLVDKSVSTEIMSQCLDHVGIGQFPADQGHDCQAEYAKEDKPDKVHLALNSVVQPFGVKFAEMSVYRKEDRSFIVYARHGDNVPNDICQIEEQKNSGGDAINRIGSGQEEEWVKDQEINHVGQCTRGCDDSPDKEFSHRLIRVDVSPCRDDTELNGGRSYSADKNYMLSEANLTNRFIKESSCYCMAHLVADGHGICAAVEQNHESEYVSGESVHKLRLLQKVLVVITSVLWLPDLLLDGWNRPARRITPQDLKRMTHRAVASDDYNDPAANKCIGRFMVIFTGYLLVASGIICLLGR